MSRAEGEIGMPRADVWRVLAEPYHFADWWPGAVGVQPDRRGFAEGARWKLRLLTSNPLAGRTERETMLLVREVVDGERIVFHLLSAKCDIAIELRAASQTRTAVTIEASGWRADPAGALKRLRDLCETGL